MSTTIPQPITISAPGRAPTPPPPLRPPTQEALPSSAFALSTSDFDAERVESLLIALADPDCALSTVAHEFKTTLSALCLWMERPDIQAALAARLNSIAIRTRFVASSYMPSVVKTLNNVLKDYDAEIDQAFPDYSNPKTTETRARARESARRTSHLLICLTRYAPAPLPRTRTQDSSSPTQDSGPTGPTSASPTKSEIPNPKSEIPLPPLPRLNFNLPTLLSNAGAAPRSNGSRSGTQPPVLSPGHPSPTQDFPLRTQDSLERTQDFPLRTQDSLEKSQDASLPFPLPTSDFPLGGTPAPPAFPPKSNTPKEPTHPARRAALDALHASLGYPPPPKPPSSG